MSLPRTKVCVGPLKHLQKHLGGRCFNCGCMYTVAEERWNATKRVGVKRKPDYIQKSCFSFSSPYVHRSRTLNVLFKQTGWHQSYPRSHHEFLLLTVRMCQAPILGYWLQPREVILQTAERNHLDSSWLEQLHKQLCRDFCTLRKFSTGLCGFSLACSAWLFALALPRPLPPCPSWSLHCSPRSIPAFLTLFCPALFLQPLSLPFNSTPPKVNPPNPEGAITFAAIR